MALKSTGEAHFNEHIILIYEYDGMELMVASVIGAVLGLKPLAKVNAKIAGFSESEKTTKTIQLNPKNMSRILLTRYGVIKLCGLVEGSIAAEVSAWIVGALKVRITIPIATVAQVSTDQDGIPNITLNSANKPKHTTPTSDLGEQLEKCSKIEATSCAFGTTHTSNLSVETEFMRPVFESYQVTDEQAACSMMGMDKLKEFFGERKVRIYKKDGKMLVAATDIGKIIGIKQISVTLTNYTLLEVVKSHHMSISGQNKLLLTERGLMKLVLGLVDPALVPFQEWVFDVIEKVKATGSYILKDEIEKSIRAEYELKHAQQSNAEAISIRKAEELTVALAQRDAELSLLRRPSEPDIPCDDFNDHPGSCLYILYLRDDDYKYGITDEVVKRAAAHRCKFKKYGIIPSGRRVFDCHTTDNARAIERKVTAYGNQHNIRVDKYDQREILTTKNIDEVYRVIERYVSELLTITTIGFANQMQLGELKVMETEAMHKLRTVDAQIEDTKVKQIDATQKLEAIRMEKARIEVGASHEYYEMRKMEIQCEMMKHSVTTPVTSNTSTPPVVVEPKVAATPKSTHTKVPVVIPPIEDFNAVVKTVIEGEYWTGTYMTHVVIGCKDTINIVALRKILPNNVTSKRSCIWLSGKGVQRQLQDVANTTGIPKERVAYEITTNINAVLNGHYLHYSLVPRLLTWSIIPVKRNDTKGKAR